MGLCNTTRICFVEFLSLGQTLCDIDNSLLIGLILQANLSQGQQSLTNLHLDGSLLLFLGKGFDFVCVSNLGELKHLPGKLEVAGILFILGLLFLLVLSFLSAITNTLGISILLRWLSLSARSSLCAGSSVSLLFSGLLLCLLRVIHLLVVITFSVFGFITS